MTHPHKYITRQSYKALTLDEATELTRKLREELARERKLNEAANERLDAMIGERLHAAVHLRRLVIAMRSAMPPIRIRPGDMDVFCSATNHCSAMLQEVVRKVEGMPQ